MTSRESRREVADKLNISEKTVELRAREWKRAAIAHLRAEQFWRELHLDAVFREFEEQLDDVDGSAIVAATLAVDLEAKSLGVPLNTYLRWHGTRMRFLELIRTFVE